MAGVWGRDPARVVGLARLGGQQNKSERAVNDDVLVTAVRVTGAAQILLAMICSPNFLLTNYKIGSIHITTGPAAIPENPVGDR